MDGGFAAETPHIKRQILIGLTNMTWASIRAAQFILRLRRRKMTEDSQKREAR